MSRGDDRTKPVSSGYQPKYRLHLFFGGVNRLPRFATDGMGRSVDEWKGMDAFEIWEGNDGGLALAYCTCERNSGDAQDWLIARGYTEFVASGKVAAQAADPTWRFEKPADSLICRAIVCELVTDPDFLRYYAKFKIIGPDGSAFGLAGSFCVPDDANN